MVLPWSHRDVQGFRKNFQSCNDFWAIYKFSPFFDICKRLLEVHAIRISATLHNLKCHNKNIKRWANSTNIFAFFGCLFSVLYNPVKYTSKLIELQGFPQANKAQRVTRRSEWCGDAAFHSQICKGNKNLAPSRAMIWFWAAQYRWGKKYSRKEVMVDSKSQRSKKQLFIE